MSSSNTGRFLCLFFVATALASCIESRPPAQAMQRVAEWGVCASIPSDRYRLSTEQIADFYLHEIADDKGQAVASVYIGHNPEVDQSLLYEIRERRSEYAIQRVLRVSGNDHPGAQFLGVPERSETAYFHVMFRDNTPEDQQQGILDMITFCPATDGDQPQ